MCHYYLAIDIGASSGRHILGHIKDGKMVLEEIYRFDNGMENGEGSTCWNLEVLFENIKAGMKKCREINKIPVSMGIDTWAVDYVLLDEENKILGKTYGYRDKRTKGMDQEVYKIISERELYEKTGIQKQIFNTIYQLMADKKKNPNRLEKAKTFLMLPDYFQFLLTGNMRSEYTNATSTQLVSAATNEWDFSLIEQLNYPKEIFLPLSQPGTLVGHLTQVVQDEVGFDCKVILVATHDTGSAVMAVPTTSDECLYISSGTWSLMGIENQRAICHEESREKNFTNEGGYNYRYRYLKNIMGLWMIQSVRHELEDEYSFTQLCELAEQSSGFPSRVDVNNEIFLAPKNMQEAIKSYCKNSGQKVPESIGEIASIIYQSLAESYAETAREIEAITGKVYDTIHIVGGGAHAAYLNKLTAKQSGKKVLAGPSEATAIGNLMAQMIEEGILRDLKEARRCVYESFEIKEFH